MNSIRNIQNESISPSEMRQLSPSATPPWLLAICKIPTFSHPVMNNNFIYLDHVSDPGNMGTILRTAQWFGTYNIPISEGCIDPFNSTVVRGAMGAHFCLSWFAALPVNDFTVSTFISADQ